MNDRFCSTCGTLNPPAARFCQACGSRLLQAAGRACPNCGELALPGDRFCDECGTALPASALFILADTGWRVALASLADQSASEASIVGREDPLSGAKPDVDLAPYDADAYGVSRRHARLGRAGSGYTLEDLGSVNLTYVNDQRLEPGRSIALKDGDHIVMGNLRLIFRQL